MTSPAVGILAGINELPVLAAKNAQEKGLRSIVVSLFPDNNPEIRDFSDIYYPADPSQLGQIIDVFKSEGVTELMMLGKVTKEILYTDFRPDAAWLSVLKRASNKSDDELLLAIVEELGQNGLTVLPQTHLLRDVLADPGVYTNRKPSASEVEDIYFGYPQAKVMAGLDVGQTLVVSGGAVMAVEAIEGTNEAILRGGKLARGPVTVIKVAKPTQDSRFDIPTVGYDTVETLAAAGGGLIALEAGEVFFVSREKSLKLAEEHGISICAINPRAIGAGKTHLLWEEAKA